MGRIRLRFLAFFMLVFFISETGNATPTFQEAFDKHNAIMLLIDPATGKLVDANVAASKFYGYTREKLRLMKIQDLNLLTPEQVAIEREAAKVEGRNFFIFRHRLSNGEVRTIESHSIPMNFDGKTLLYSVIQDITAKRNDKDSQLHYAANLEEMVDLQTRDIEQKSQLIVMIMASGLVLLTAIVAYLVFVLKKHKLIQSALIESENRYRKSARRLDEIIWGTNVGTWEWNIATGETIYSDRWAEIIGYTLEELAPVSIETWRRFSHPVDTKKSGGMLVEMFKRHSDYYDFEGRMRHKNGEWIWIVERAKVVEWDADGRALRMSGMRQDITQRKTNEINLKKAQKDAEDANRSKSDFLASMSHEIRTPMTGVIGFADMLLEDNLAEGSREKVLKIKQSTHSLLSIINDILDMSKMEAGKMVLEEIDFHLPSLVKSVTTLFENNERKNSQLRLVTVFSDDVPDTIKSDPTRLRQILVNLVGNAVKFTDKGCITIECKLISEKQGKWLHFSVCDEGIGMSPETVATIFSEFTQADASISRRYEGAGLGLAICKKLTDLGGGEIGVESELGIGSKFWFTLPYVKATTIVAANSEEAPTREFTALRSLAILVAEDNETNQLIVRKILESYGHVVSVVTNGLEAVEAVEKGDFDLVLMDVRMPEMSGTDATIKIRQLDNKNSNIPIIALTADAMTENRRTYAEAGMDDCVTKPFERSDLVLAINKVLKEVVHTEILKVDMEQSISDASGAKSLSLGEIVSGAPLPIGDERKIQELKGVLGSQESITILASAADVLDKQMMELRQGLEDADSTKIFEVAHSIKGSSGTLFGQRLSSIAAAIQDHAEDLEQVRGMMSLLEQTAQETIVWWNEKTRELEAS